MPPFRNVVGLFPETTAAQAAAEHLLRAGFSSDAIRVATPDTLRAQHLLPADPAAEETFEAGVVRFFTDLFAGNDGDPRAHAAATRPDSAVLTVQAASPEAADTARALLDAHGAVDVYKQAAPPAAAAGRADDVIDLAGDMRRVRDADGLDANGLTTH